MVFGYDEETLSEVSNYALSTCIKAMDDFPSMFKDDPMINFPTPAQLGFSVSRGTACCLFSGRSVIDYSGQLLNLAERLNDFARPKGIVLDGSFLQEIIPEDLHSRFKSSQVYIRGIAEDKSREIFYLHPEVKLPHYAFAPIVGGDWDSFDKNMTVAELKKIETNLIIVLPKETVSKDSIKLEFLRPDSRSHLKNRF